MKKIAILLLLLLNIDKVNCQDLEFSQVNNSRILSNPSLAGSDSGIFVNVGYRNQWPGLAGNFVSYFVSTDAHIDKLKTSIGLIASADHAGQNSISSKTYSFIIAPQFNLKKNDWVIKPAIQLSYIQTKLDPSKFSFSDMIDTKYGFVLPTISVFPNTRRNYFDFSSSLLVYNKWASLGLGYFHITQPNQSFMIGSSAPLYSRLMVNFNTKYFHFFANKKYGLAFSAFYNRQSVFQQLTTRVSLAYNKMSVSIAYQNGSAIIVGFGLNYSKFSFVYSYDINVTKLRKSQGSHEIILGTRILSKKIKNKRPIFRIIT